MPKSATIGVPVVQQDVLRLDVAMHDAAAVRVLERVGDFARDAHRVVDGQLLFALEPLAQRFARDERHHVVQQLVRRLAGIDKAAGCADD